MSLLVYKSSAGSGKTTTLVSEYLKIALKHPPVFRHVLAITFTNKAANEMKERILEALEDIISGKAWQQGKYSNLLGELDPDQEKVIENAKQLQTLILHNYDEFAVSTIDSFVHRIIRTFATDVKLPQNFEVVIDEDDIIPNIVELLFDQVGSEKDLTDIMVKFVMSQTDDEKGYDPGRSIAGFVKKQLGEEGFHQLQKIDHLSTGEFVEIIKKIEQKWNSVTSIIKKNGKEALDLIQKLGLSKADFYQSRSGIYLYFEKSSKLAKDDHLHPNSYVQTTLGEDKWTSGKANADARDKIDSIKDELVDRFNNIMEKVDAYFLYKLIRQKIYSLALTKEIRSIFLDFTDRSQKVHISEFNKRISQEIALQPVPFIYERLGRKFRYFLIDEFQDTSVLQWNNLLPLIEESLSNGNFNMLVGDAKQAIYRFRSGEVELFASLPSIYQNDGSPETLQRERNLKAHYKEEIIRENWRSKEEIIRFNNHFFGTLKEGFSDKLKEIYDYHLQDVPPKPGNSGGYVALEFMEAEKPDEYAELRLQKIGDTVEKLLKSGYALHDICVLSRSNKSAIEVASFLLSKNHKVISSESLLLTNASEVRLIIAFFMMLIHPQQKIYLAEFVHNLLVIKKEDRYFHNRFVEILPHLETNLKNVLEQLNIDISPEEMSYMPVYDMTEYLVRQFHFVGQTNIYLQYFLDFVFQAQENGRMTVDSFIEYWNKKKSKAFISMPEGDDAIKVMTVHKAKGLDFEAVIVDITDRRSLKGKSEFWTELNLEGLPEMEIGLLPMVRDLKHINMEEVYVEEEQKTELDFINMVYVAFTRPVSALIALGHVNDKREKFSGYLQSYLKSSGLWEEGKLTYAFGELQKNKEVIDEDREKETADEDQNKEVALEKMISTEWEKYIKVAPVDDVYWEAIESKPARTYGNLVHAILAQIKYAGDIERAVNAFRLNGIIDEAESYDIRLLLQKIVNHTDLRDYFRKDVIVKNESELIDLSGNGKTLQRPDRVVVDGDKLAIIDYKTGEKLEKHKKQIATYADAFSSMGYTNIHKKLVYINDDIEVVGV